MASRDAAAEEAKRSAVALYGSCAFDQLLQNTLRPGGLDLTKRLAAVAGLGRGHLVLDIACGKGTTAFFLAREHGCRVVGLDLSEQMIAISRQKAAQEELPQTAGFLVGDAERLPFASGCFDVVVAECSFSLLPDKEAAAREICRVLKPGGKLAMTDIVLRGDVSDELRSQAGFACCLGGAWKTQEYVDLLVKVGLKAPYLEDHSDEMRELAFRFALAFGATGSAGGSRKGPCEMKPAARSIISAQLNPAFLKIARPGYALIALSK
ncbi:MAG: methyltransferase domain-containing protein [Chloroflexi bacterium]|nr:methyltransferase domain-containing protein [Chloroflexota bacterium]